MHLPKQITSKMPLQLAGKVHLSDNNKKDQSSGNERLRSKLLQEI